MKLKGYQVISMVNILNEKGNISPKNVQSVLSLIRFKRDLQNEYETMGKAEQLLSTEYKDDMETFKKKQFDLFNSDIEFNHPKVSKTLFEELNFSLNEWNIFFDVIEDDSNV